MLTIARLLTTSSLSTTHRGTAFEERSLKILKTHLSMSLRRVGGKSDGGIDLLGWWWLPPFAPNSPTRRRFRVLAQCKAEKKKISPNYVREMEGVLHRYVTLSAASKSQHPLVALLISESSFTKSTILRAQSSPIPFFLLHIPPLPTQAIDDEQESAWTGTAVWNPALAGTHGLFNGDMELRWERSISGDAWPGLWWRDQKLQNWAPKDTMDLDIEGEDRILRDLT